MLYDSIDGMLEIKEKEVVGQGRLHCTTGLGPPMALWGYVPRRDRTTEGEHCTICISLTAAFLYS
jgi:hypothetical protein